MSATENANHEKKAYEQIHDSGNGFRYHLPMKYKQILLCMCMMLCACGKAETKTILNHTYFITEGKEASCFSAGITDVKYCNVCGTYSVAAEIPKLEHEDKNKDNKCDLCFSPIVFNGKFCGCICHSEKPFFQKIMPIIVFIWKLLGIDSCPCGTVHY
jgi:hypothetical protein